MMAKAVWTVDSEETIEKVEALVNRRKLSAVPVVDAQGAVFGILSLLDLLHFHAAKKNPKAVRAWELCTYKPISVAPETQIAAVAQLMLTNKIHHILVVEGGKLQGIVSALDFVEQYVLRET